jgi:DNA-directed RNA polymerase subunit RPC12/RpoP
VENGTGNVVINMACPKCGGQATEYDENKWSCLRCGNKFLYAPAQPSHTYVQSNVHVQGEATFELDTKNAKPSIPRMAKMAEHDPNRFGKCIAETRHDAEKISRRLFGHKVQRIIALVVTIFTVLILAALLGSSNKNNGPDSDDATLLWFWGLLTMLPLFALLSLHNKVRYDKSLLQKLQQRVSTLEQQNVTDTRIGDNVTCPYCEALSSYIPLNSPPPAEGLKHCLKCGKQFFTSGLTSYPVLFNK